MIGCRRSIWSRQSSCHKSHFAHYWNNLQDLCKADCIAHMHICWCGLELKLNANTSARVHKGSTLRKKKKKKKTHRVIILHVPLRWRSRTPDCGWCQMFPWGPEAVVMSPVFRLLRAECSHHRDRDHTLWILKVSLCAPLLLLTSRRRGIQL